jgi:hypothetical protein
MLYLWPKFTKETITLTSIREDIVNINELQSSHDPQNYVSNHANQVKHTNSSTTSTNNRNFKNNQKKTSKVHSHLTDRQGS